MQNQGRNKKAPDWGLEVWHGIKSDGSDLLRRFCRHGFLNAHYRRGFDSGSLFMGCLRDLTSLDALGAHDQFAHSSVDDGAHMPQIRQPFSFCQIMGVADGIANPGFLTANSTNSCHFKSPVENFNGQNILAADHYTKTSGKMQVRSACIFNNFHEEKILPKSFAAKHLDVRYYILCGLPTKSPTIPCSIFGKKERCSIFWSEVL
jgi:hypothetical protein